MVSRQDPGWACTADTRQERRNRLSADTLFEIELPVSMVRLRLASVWAPWARTRNIKGRRGAHADEPWARELIGCGVDGSLYHFTLLSQEAWRLLRFVQNLCGRSREICPHGGRAQGKNHIEPRADLPRFKNVDGDVLRRLLAPGRGATALRELLRAEPLHELKRAGLDFDTAAARQKRFVALARDLLGETSEDPVADVIGYLETVLQTFM